MKPRGLAIAFATVVLVCALTACSSSEPGLSAADLQETGERNLLEGDYRQALLYFTQLIRIEPGDPRGYIGAADSHIGLGQGGGAIAVLRDGLDRIPDDADIRAMLDGLIAQEPPDAASHPPSEGPNGDVHDSPPVSVPAPPLNVADDVLDVASKISDALDARDFGTAWELSSNDALMSFLHDVHELDTANHDAAVFKYADVLFTLISPSIPDAYGHFSAELISVDGKGDGTYIMFTLGTYRAYEYPTYEVFTVSSYALTGAYELFSYPGGRYNDEVSLHFSGQVVDGKYEGALTREVHYNHGGVAVTEEEWSGGANPRYPGGPYPTGGLSGYVQYIAGLPNW